MNKIKSMSTKIIKNFNDLVLDFSFDFNKPSVFLARQLGHNA